MERVKIDDLVVLGTAVPDEISDNRKTVCAAGYSPTHGLIRIYPVPPWAPMNRWNVVEVPLERNPQDTRIESWKIQGSKSEWRQLAEKLTPHGKLAKKEQISLLKRLDEEFGAKCVKDLNEQRKSLGIIRPQKIKHRMAIREEYEKTVQLELFSDKPFQTIHNYDIQPRIKYRCSECRAEDPHDQQILEWGVYEWIRKHPDNVEQVWKNLHLGESGYDTRFLVGNMARHRTSFMIISILRHKTNL